ncbi:LegC family aminotransferase [Aurantivibrio infirmus]
MYSNFIRLVRDIYKTENAIPLHEPRFLGNEKKYVSQAIDSTFVSSVGEFVDRFEEMFALYTGAKHAVAVVNGTAALHVTLVLAGVEDGDEVITQPLTFIATCNAISYCGAVPVFIDVDRESMGLSPEKLKEWLFENAEIEDDVCKNKKTRRTIRACVPMHTFGHPVQIEEIKNICNEYKIILIEDSAESLGSYYLGKHTGTFGLLGAFSFNGNKTITTGGGGMIITNDKQLARRAKHITTTAKMPHRWEYVHDQVAYNYRLPNLNAALGCAQLEQLPVFLEKKAALAELYRLFFEKTEIKFVSQRSNCVANYWLNTVILDGKDRRNEFLKETNDAGIMTRPVWALMSQLVMFSGFQKGNLDNAVWLEERLVNIPSSVVQG